MMMKKTLAIAIITTFFCVQIASYSKNNISKAEVQKISQIIIKDLKEHNCKRPKIEGIYISVNYALVYSTCGESGGEAILRKVNNKWKIIEQAGGAYTQQALIEIYKIPKRNVDDLMNQINKGS
jgi:hypothetical protein